MFFHIGSSRIVLNNDLIGIFNIDLIEDKNNSHISEAVDRKIHKLDHKALKSFIVTRDDLYFSQISPFTLSKRVNFLK